MLPIAIGTTATVFALIGLVVGIVVLMVVIGLLQGTLTPLRKVLADVRSAQTAPMLERGIPGTDQIGQTRRLAESVPDLALRYLQKLSARGMPAPPPAAAPPPPPAYNPTTQAPPPPPAPAPGQIDAPAEQPAWKRYSS
ncbi:MAG: hypothetical protein ACR2LK_13790 [Solirubrobacteraceae bacterium]